jgi:DNA-binding NarL/FixJ family response regulator
MKHQDLRTPEQKFDDLLAEGLSLDDIAYRLGWGMYRVKRHYRSLCEQMGEEPDED